MEYHPYPLSFSDMDEEELKAKVGLYLVARAHYNRIMSETELLLKYIEVFGHTSVIEALEDIREALCFIDERISEIDKVIKSTKGEGK